MTARKIGHACLHGTEVPAAVMARQARETVSPYAYDTMVGTGMSGSLVVPVLARELGKHWLIVRKETDRHHHRGADPAADVAQGTLGDRWLLVDDGMDTGSTAKRLLGIVPSLNPGTQFAGAYFYGDHDWQHPGQFFTPGKLSEWIADREDALENDPFERFIQAMRQHA